MESVNGFPSYSVVLYLFCSDVVQFKGKKYGEGSSNDGDKKWEPIEHKTRAGRHASSRGSRKLRTAFWQTNYHYIHKLIKIFDTRRETNAGDADVSSVGYRSKKLQR